MHLAVDGYGGDQQKMMDVALVRRFLETFPTRLGMTPLCEPVVLTYDGPKQEDSGVSGFVIIAESHISIHTFPYRNHVNIDIFSCKAFDTQLALEEVKRLFALEDVKVWELKRGLEYQDSQEALQRVASEREVLANEGAGGPPG